MRRGSWLRFGIAAVATVGLLCWAVAGEPARGDAHMAFGGEGDVAFAEALWSAMNGYENWPMQSGVYPGMSPHGKFLKLYYNLVPVEGETYHLIIKDNFGGADLTKQTVMAAPQKHLQAVTIMLQREPGYDSGNQNWFWAKYAPDGSVATNPQGTALAGRVAKGSGQGCIACHRKAGGGDYVFANDTE
ncbi:MAG: hypothetical protein GF330_10350 [Candidatus Eisenbacteria bacterium]|nr:hypothetical protein [Candidatus Eisenbacteria bacterium]